MEALLDLVILGWLVTYTVGVLVTQTVIAVALIVAVRRCRQKSS